ncbi:DUF4875 domain-containing protein [Halodesulfovibrio spirochaetisodalis]|uniref:DUF4875 domain-containing protein n=1 Tax=Halodesulfovibrio spirochaetisodalis TaxID=1560234 RepID=A0A1B7XA50_9BACT|nr:hypothetical protein [Halodesulfovibrio spirochaetisodalis]OBQ46251.1 hypothetical protein SP90_13745 [Halodesulfovibrio spirochaetisodalis]
MRYLVCAFLAGFIVFCTLQSSKAEVKKYKCVAVKSENVQEPDLRRMRATVVVSEAHLLSKKDLVDTAKAAALELFEKSKMQVIVVKLYPSKEYAEYFPQMLDMTYAPEAIGWDGKPAATWVAYIAEKMPSEEEMFRIRTWIVEQAKNKQTILDRKQALAKKMKIPVDDVYFPIFNLVPCLMENES